MPKSPRALILVGLILLPVAVGAATFNVSTTVELEAALASAAINNQDDEINLAAGIYPVINTLTYWPATEGRSLTIQGPVGGGAVLDGGGAVQIMSVSTLSVPDDRNVSIVFSYVTFQNGDASGANDDGGGLFFVSDQGHLRVYRCQFLDNYANDDGGGLYAEIGIINYGPINLIETLFEGNVARGLSNHGDGGGAHLGATYFIDANVSGNTFIDNRAQRNGGGLEVEGIEPGGDVPQVRGLLMVGNVFRDNIVTGLQGNGGGAYVAAIGIELTDNQFYSNSAASGGGMHVQPDYASIIAMNNVFLNNVATETSPGVGGYGGGLDLMESLDPSIVFVQHTFAGNTATVRGGGAILRGGGAATTMELYNNIIWGNGAAEGADLWIDDDPYSATPAGVDLFNNLFLDVVVRCETDPGCVASVNAGDNGPGDPRLADLPGNDPHLLQDSAAIDAGTWMAPYSSGKDFEGDLRPFDGDGDTITTIDIGADEYIGPPQDSDGDGIPDGADNCTDVVNPSQVDTNFDGFGNHCDADVNDDCAVNFGDLAMLKAAFTPRPYNPDVDFNDDGFINFADLAVMKATFFNGPNPGPGPSGQPHGC